VNLIQSLESIGPHALDSFLDFHESFSGRYFLAGSIVLNHYGIISRPCSDIDVCMTETEAFFDFVDKYTARVHTYNRYDRPVNNRPHGDFHIRAKVSVSGTEFCVANSFPESVSFVPLQEQLIPFSHPSFSIRFKRWILLRGRGNNSKHLSDIQAYENWLRINNLPDI
jgi:hypothetical protein